MRWVVGAIAVAALAGAATAGQVTFTDGVGGFILPGYGSGGAFVAHTTDNGIFETFCVELNEHVNPNGTELYDYVVNPYAEKGGIVETDNFIDGKDELSDTTRNIYYAFWTNSAALNSFGSNQAEINNVIQMAIWMVEENATLADYAGTGSGSFGSYATFSLAVLALIDTYDDGLNIGAARVQVMNLTRNGHYMQDQLIVVPLPTGSGLACAGLLGVATIRRRRH